MQVVAAPESKEGSDTNPLRETNSTSMVEA